MFIPEIKIHSLLTQLIDLIRTDWENETDKTRTILYDFYFQDDCGTRLVFNTADYYQLAQNLFLRQENKNDRLAVNIGYNLQRQGLPTIHILMPSAQKGPSDGLGFDEGYEPVAISPDGEERKMNRTRTYNVKYQLMISSNNVNEVLLIWHLLLDGFQAIFDNIELNGMQNLQLSGQDLLFNNDIVPPEIFHRSVMMDFFYENTVKQPIWERIIQSINYNGRVTEGFIQDQFQIPTQQSV